MKHRVNTDFNFCFFSLSGYLSLSFYLYFYISVSLYVCLCICICPIIRPFIYPDCQPCIFIRPSVHPFLYLFARSMTTHIAHEELILICA